MSNQSEPGTGKISPSGNPHPSRTPREGEKEGEPSAEVSGDRQWKGYGSTGRSSRHGRGDVSFLHLATWRRPIGRLPMTPQRYSNSLPNEMTHASERGWGEGEAKAKLAGAQPRREALFTLVLHLPIFGHQYTLIHNGSTPHFSILYNILPGRNWVNLANI